MPADFCLLGCVFFIGDYQKSPESADDVPIWTRVIEQHGGEVVDNYSNRVTHLMCQSQRSEVYQMVRSPTG